MFLQVACSQGSHPVRWILTEKKLKMQQCIKILLFLILNEAQHVSGATPPIIRSLNCTSSLWFCICGSACATWQRPTTERLTAFHVCKTRDCLCSFRLLMMGGVAPETCWASFKIRNKKILIHCCILLGFFPARIVLWCTDLRTLSEMNVFGQHIHCGFGDHEISFACCCKLFTFVYFLYFIHIWEWEST